MALNAAESRGSSICLLLLRPTLIIAGLSITTLSRDLPLPLSEESDPIQASLASSSIDAAPEDPEVGSPPFEPPAPPGPEEGLSVPSRRPNPK